MFRALLALMMLLTVSPAIAGGPTGDVTRVSLRAGARVDPAGPVTLGQIADLEGPLAESLGGLVVEADSGSLLNRATPGSVSIQRVRDLVLAHAEESTVMVQGTACELRGRAPARTTTATPRLNPQTVAGPTLRDQVTSHLQALFGVEPGDLRIGFEDRDEALLSTPIEGRVVEVRAMGSGRKIPLGVAVYDGTRIAAEGTVRVEVTLRRDVVVISTDLARGATIDPEHFRVEQRWVATDDDSCSPAEAVGQMTRRRVRTGETLTTDQLEPPILISRGDIVMVRSVMGAAAVRLRARAMGDGRLGEQIELEHTTQQNGREQRRRITARVIGPGRAIIGAGTPQGPTE